VDKAIKIIENEMKRIDYKQGLAKMWKKKNMDSTEMYKFMVLVHRKDVLKYVLKKIKKASPSLINKKEPFFRSLTEEQCFKQYGFSKEDMEELYNEGKPICSALHSYSQNITKTNNEN
jgi:hypothetical protein